MRLKKDIDQAWIEEDFGSGTEKFLVRRWTGKIVDELNEKHNKHIKLWQFLAKVWFLRKSASKVLISKVAAWESDVYDWILRDWDGIFQEDGVNKALCNRKNKILLIETSEKRKNWIMTKASLPQTFDMKIEELVKNLLSPSNIKPLGSKARDNRQTVPSA